MIINIIVIFRMPDNRLTTCCLTYDLHLQTNSYILILAGWVEQRGLCEFSCVLSSHVGPDTLHLSR